MNNSLLKNQDTLYNAYKKLLLFWTFALIIIFFWQKEAIQTTAIIVGLIFLSVLYFIYNNALIVDLEKRTNRLKVLILSYLCVADLLYCIYNSDFNTFDLVYFCCLIYIGIKIKKTKEFNSLILEFTTPVIILFIIETLQKRTVYLVCYIFLNNTQIERFIFIGTIVFIYLFIKCFTIFNIKEKISYYISGSILFLIGIVNYFVLTLTEHPFIPSDILSAKTAANVAGTQSLDNKEWGYLLLCALFIIIYYTFVNYMCGHIKFNKQNINLRATITMIGILLCMLISIFAIYTKGSVLQFESHYKYGFIYNFIVNLDYGIDYPQGLEKYTLDKSESKANEVSEENPNVIIIMNEAFSDLGTTYDLKLNKDPLEYFHKLQREYASGISYSSVRGNNTVSSEWESLSGVSTALTNKGSEIYQENCKPMYSLVDLFNDRGYYTVGIHCGDKSGYNRDNVYNALGFDKVCFKDNFDDNLKLIRIYISDKDNYKKLIEIYKNHGNEPFFGFNVTIQNHGGYEEYSYDKKIKLKGYKDRKDMEQYLNLVDKSDEALEYLISYFQTVKEPTIILFFGDHQPVGVNSFHQELLGKEDLNLKETSIEYKIPYLIWSNYKINKDLAPKETSMNYLSSVLFDVGNIRKSDWLNKLSAFSKEYPVLTENFYKTKTGDVKSTSELITNKSKFNKSSLYQYKMFSYNILFGE